MKVVADTSVLVDHLRGGNEWTDFIEHADRTISLYLPTIVLYELFAGNSAEDPAVQEQISQLTKRFQKIDLTAEIAKEAGRLYRSGVTKLEAPDYVIAASALTLDASLITLNYKHFRRLPGLLLYPQTR